MNLADQAQRRHAQRPNSVYSKTFHASPYRSMPESSDSADQGFKRLAAIHRLHATFQAPQQARTATDWPLLALPPAEPEQEHHRNNVESASYLTELLQTTHARCHTQLRRTARPLCKNQNYNDIEHLQRIVLLYVGQARTARNVVLLYLWYHPEYIPVEYTSPI